MIELYTWTTPNGRKVSIMLEECGLSYEVKPVNIGAGEQFDPAFLKISPNNRIPAIVDPDGPGGKPIALMESAAILIYLADKTGKFLAPEGEARYRQLEWAMWQMGNIGPMLGQLNHFVNTAPEQIPYAIGRYLDESVRLLRILNDRLGDADYVGGDYSIADMLIYPWVKVAFPRLLEMKGGEFGKGKNIARWFEALEARPGVQKGMAVPEV